MRDPEEPDSGTGKFVVLAILVLAVLGAITVWFLQRAPHPAPPPSTKAPAPLEREEPKTELPIPPPAPETDVPSSGSIHIGSNVDGATVYVDGKEVGQAPYDGTGVATGRHQVRVSKDGYQTFETEVRVRGGARAELTATLELAPSSLRIVSDVPGATVFLDRNYLGTTPVDVKTITAGEHQLTVSAEGYDMHAETVNVTTGHQEISVSFKNVQLHETLPVVHKHGMGSCEGTLVADNSGLRYETSNKGDAFRVPFSALDQFEVDYIKKNLNVKVRKGKNYNFTEKSGNADALFVFQKNVKAFIDLEKK
jgi:PEGA domain